MRCGTWAALVPTMMLMAMVGAHAEECGPTGGPVQMRLLSRFAAPDHAWLAWERPSLTRPAAAAERTPQSLEEHEARWRAIEDYFSSVGPQQQERVYRKAAPALQRLGPKSPSEMEYIHALQFMGRKGWALEWHGLLYETGDGGATWTSRRVPVPRATVTAQRGQRAPDWPANDDDALRDLRFISPQAGFALGQQGVIATRDGGATWLQLGNPSRNRLLTLSCVAEGTCWVAGYEAGVLYRRRAGSPIWDAQATPMSGGTVAVRFIDAQTGWAVGDAGEIAATTDGGAHWTLQHADRNTRLWSVYFLDSQRGWAAGENGVLLRSEDGGRTWTEGELVIPPSLPRYLLRLHAVLFRDEKTGWAAGLNGVTLATTDGGRCWRVVRYEALAPWLSVYALALGEGSVIWAAGNSGNLIASRDGGRFWFPVSGLSARVVPILEEAIRSEGR